MSRVGIELSVLAKPLKLVLAIPIAVVVLVLYIHVTQVQSPRNHVLSRNDQIAHMNFTRRAYETNLRYTGDRNYMPLYAFIQAAFYSPDLDDEELFEHGKRTNVALSVIALILLTIAFFSKFSRFYASYAIMAIAFLCFSLKAPFFQPEILYYTLFAFSFIMSLEALFAPKWYKSVGTGVFFALAHLTKASAMPVLLLFVGFHGVLFLTLLLRRKLDAARAAEIVMRALTPLYVFLIILFPYFQETKEKYGDYFFNLNTRLVLWLDTWDQVSGLLNIEDYNEVLKWPEDKIPSLEKYLREHSVEQIIERFQNGIHTLVSNACYRTDSRYLFGYCSQVASGILVLVFAVPLLIRRFFQHDKSEQFHIILYVTSLFLIYGLAAAWYVPVSGSASKGPRFILALLVPFFWTMGLIIHTEPVYAQKIAVIGRRFRIVDLAYVLISMTALYEIYLLIRWRAGHMYGGK